MAMTDSTRKQILQDLETIDQSGNPVTTQIKIIQRIYPCRPQVLERRDGWVKFGAMTKDVERGKNQKGIFNVTGPVGFITDEGEELNQEIQIAKDLIEMGKKQKMRKQLKI